MDKPTKEKRYSLAVQIVIGLWGLFLSIVLHEAYHVAMHWGHITHIEFFPNLTTVMQIDTQLPAGYNLDDEELVAYGITLAVAIITAMIIFRTRDKADKRTTAQMLFPEDKNMQKMDPEKMLELSGLDDPDHTGIPLARGTKKGK